MKTITLLTIALMSLTLLMSCSDQVGQSLMLVERELKQLFQVPLLDGDVTVRRASHHLTVVLTERLLFDAGSDEITPAGITLLTQMASLFKMAPLMEIRVTGHTESPSTLDRSDEFFLKLASSKSRATHAVRVLKDSGVNPHALFIEWYGDSRPIASNPAAGGRQRNGRLEIALHPWPPLPEPALVLSGNGS